MKATGIVRRLDELGRIVLPKELRTEMDLNNGDGLEIFVENNTIVLRKNVPYCIFCGSSTDLVIFNGKNVCKNCIKEISRNIRS